jgi:RNA polymerase sigma-70 factor (ECF subfamily)
MITTAAQKIVNDSRDPRSSVPEEYWELLEQYRVELVNQAIGILGNRDDAEDVVQKTFVETFSDSSRIPQTGSIGHWLRMINRRNALDRAREIHRGAAHKDPRRFGDSAFTTGGFSMLELRDSVRKALEKLPAELRTVVRMRYFEHLSSKEISEQLKIPFSTLKRQLFQANVLLHGVLKEQFKSQSRPGSQPGDLDSDKTDTSHPGTQA